MAQTISGEARPTRTDVSAISLAFAFMSSKGYWPKRDKDLENEPAEKEKGAASKTIRNKNLGFRLQGFSVKENTGTQWPFYFYAFSHFLFFNPIDIFSLPVAYHAI